MYTLMDFFRETISRPLGGAAPWNFYTLYRDWPRLTSTHPKGDAPPKKKSWKIKICLKIQRARVHNFRNSGSIFTKLFRATYHYCERNFVFPKLIFHSDLRRRAAWRLALPCQSSLFCSSRGAEFAGPEENDGPSLGAGTCKTKSFARIGAFPALQFGPTFSRCCIFSRPSYRLP